MNTVADIRIPKNKRFKKVAIIVSFLILIGLILLLAKILILSPLASDQNVLSEETKSNTYSFKNATIAGEKSSAPPQQKKQVAPPPQPAPSEPEQSSQTNTENTTENTAANTAANAETEDTTNETKKTATPSQNDKFIDESPIRVSEIQSISKFRGCAEEAFGKTSFQNQKEQSSSLAHYIKLKDSSTVYAPFAGKIIYKKSDRLVIEKSPFNGWLIDISGIKPKENLDKESDVTSGMEIGDAANTVKISVSGFAESQEEKSYKEYAEENLDSFFSHLTDSLSTEFKDKGAPPDSIIISKSTRDGKDCEFAPDNEDDWVLLN